MLADLYYDPRAASAFSSYEKLKRAAKTKSASHIKAWLQKQDAYTLHKPDRKRFPRIPYSVNNISDVFKCDLVDVQALSKYNDVYKYLLTVIRLFKILAYSPKTGRDVSSAFLSVLQDRKYLKPLKRRPVCVRTEEFLNTTFQNLLKHEGTQFQVCKKPDIKCCVVERAHRSVRDKLYKFFTFKNTYIYIDVLQYFVAGYNASVHRSTGMAPASVTDSVC